MPLDDLGSQLDELLASPFAAQCHLEAVREKMRPLGEDVAERTHRAIESYPPKPFEAKDKEEETNLFLGKITEAPPPPNGILIAKWESFKEQLGPYDSILCLGNGPSSERPEVIHKPHDCLFRINLSWIGRGILDRPKVIFAGTILSILHHQDPETIFALSTPEWAVKQFALLKDQRPPPFLYHFLYDTPYDIPIDHVPGKWPTSGVYMLATAVRLQPKRIILAGIDLFSHPRGRYPGDFQSVNEYAHAHSKEYEVQCIITLQKQFQGETVIMSPILADALREVGYHHFTEE